MIRYTIALTTSFVLLALLTGPQAVQAQSSSNKASGSWDTAGDWTPAGVPTSATSVTIGNTGVLTDSDQTISGAGTRFASSISLAGTGAGSNGTLLMTGGANLAVVNTLTMSNQTSGISLFSLNGSTGTFSGASASSVANGSGATAEISLNNSTLSLFGLDLVNTAQNGSRATLTATNSGWLRLTGGNLTVASGNPVSMNALAKFQVDANSRITLLANGAAIDLQGADSATGVTLGAIGAALPVTTGVAVYNMPLASSAAELGKIYTSGISNISSKNSGGNISKVLVNIDSTLADSGGYKQAASTGLINWRETGLNIANASTAVGVLNLNQVSITNFGSTGGTNNRIAENGGNGTIFMNASKLAHSSNQNTDLDLVTNGAAGGRATLSLINGSKLSWKNGNLQIQVGNTPGSDNTRGFLNVDATSSINFHQNTSATGAGGLQINGAQSVGGTSVAGGTGVGATSGIAKYSLPLGSTPNSAGKMFFETGINNFGARANGATVSKVWLDIDSTAADYNFTDYDGVVRTYKAAATTDPINFQNGGFNGASANGAVGILTMKGVTITNWGTSGGTNNRPANNGGNATFFLDASKISHAASISTDLDLVQNGANNSRATFSLSNGSQLNWHRGDLVVVNGNPGSNNARAFLNVDSTSSINFAYGALRLNGAESSGIAVYNIPLASSFGQAGKMYFQNGITQIASSGSGGNVSQVTVNVDSTAPDYTFTDFDGVVRTYKAAASSAPITFSNNGLALANGSGTNGRLNVTGVKFANIGSATWVNSGSTGRVDMNSSTMDFNGQLSVAGTNTTGNDTLNLNMTDSKININNNGGNLTIGNASTNKQIVNVNTFTNSQVNINRGSLEIRGRDAASAAAVYSLALSDAFNPGNGKWSFNQNLNVANIASSLVTLNATSSSSASVRASGGMNLATGSAALATLNVDTTKLLFAGSGNFANSSTSKAIVGLNNGAGMEFHGGLTLRSGATITDRTAAINNTTAGTSVLDGGNSFSMNGRVGVTGIATNGILNVDYGALARDGNLSTFAGAVMSDGTFNRAGWIVNAGSGGQVVLRNIRGTTGYTGAATTWGQLSSDLTPFLVNAIRIGASTTSGVGDLAIGVVDQNAFTGGSNKVGAFSVQTTGGLTFSTAPTLTFRYNDSLGPDAALRVFQLQGASWVDVTGTLTPGVKTISTNPALMTTAMGNFVIADTAPTSLTPVTITPFNGNRTVGTTMRFTGTTNNVWDGASNNWGEVSATEARRAVGPESRDVVEIGSTAPGTANATVTLNNSTANVVRGLTVNAVAGNSSLTVTGAGTSLRSTVNALALANSAAASTGALRVQSGAVFQNDAGASVGNQLNAAATLEADGAGSKLLIGGDVTVAQAGTTLGNRPVVNLNAINGGLIDIRGNLIVGNTLMSGIANFSLAGSGMINIGGGIGLRGSNDGAGTGFITYNLPLAAERNTAGKIFANNGISDIAASGGASKIILNLTTAGGNASDPILDWNSGSMTIANQVGSYAQVNLTGVTLNNIGSSEWGRRSGTIDLTMSSATVNMLDVQNWGAAENNNDTFNLSMTNSKINIARGNLNVGLGGNMVLNVTNFDSTSQINVYGGVLNLNGRVDASTNKTYSLPLALNPNTPGKMFFASGVTLASVGAGSRVTLNLDSTNAVTPDKRSDSIVDWGTAGLSIATQNSTFGTLNLTGMTLNAVGASEWSRRGGLATINMTNSTINGSGDISIAANTDGSGTLTLSMTNSKINRMSGNLTIGNNQANSGVQADRLILSTFDSTSQINLYSGRINIAGSNAAQAATANSPAGTAVYTLPFATYANTNGKIFSNNGFSVASATGGSNTKVELNISNTGPMASDTLLNFDASTLDIATASGSLGRVIVDGVNITGVNGATIGRRSNSDAVLKLTNSTLTNTGSTLGSNDFYVSYGENAGEKAQIVLNNGHIVMNGSGSFRNRNAQNGGSPSNGSTEIRGTGSITMYGTGNFVQDGRIVADGGTLSISIPGTGVLTSSNRTVAQATFGQAGLYAVNAGRLDMPSLAVTANTAITWGEDSADTTPDFVNSLRFTTLAGMTAGQPQTLSGSVLAPTNIAVPAGIYKPVSIWEFSGLTFTSANMQARFDDALAAVNGTPENKLKLLHYTGGAWVNITNGAVDTVNNYINSNAISSLSPFAVAQAVTPLAAYWTGDQNSVWTTDNATNTNWATDATGATDTEAPPGSVSNVFFTANSAINLSTTLGADFSIKSLTFTGAGTSATSSVTIGGANMLTVGSGGMYVNPGSGAHTISSNMTFGTGFPGWNNDSSNLFTIAGNVNSGTAVAAIAGTGNSLISGNVTGGGSLVKNGLGTLTMTGAASNYTGTTVVNQGKMIVNGTHTGGGLYTVNNGGTLGGSGSISAAVLVNNGGTLSPGNSPGTFGTGAETWSSGGNLLFEINDATGTAGIDPGWDLLAISGTLNLSALSAGNEFNIELTSLTLGNVGGNAANFSAAGSYAWLFADAVSSITTYTGDDQFLVDTTAFINPFTGAFQVLRGDNPLVTALVAGANNTELYLYYANAAAVPEPSTYALGLIGLVGLGLFIWRKRRSK